MFFDDDDRNGTETSDFFGSAPMAKMPSGGSPQPISPGFGMTGRPPGVPRPGFRPQDMQGHPLDFRGQRRAPQSLRGSRASALLPPPGLLAGDGDKAPDRNDRDMPAYFIDDVNIDYNWFSPFQPVYPFGPPYVNYPREWDYPVGVNLDFMPARLQQCEMLRTLVQGWGVLAVEIEAKIDELIALPWKFILKNPKKGQKSEDDPRIKTLTEFFKRPDRKHPYPIWAQMIIRDRFVIDAACAYIWKNRAQNAPYAIEPLDGATIKPLIDDSGRIPDFPEPAYQQIIKGLPMNNYTEREIVYMPARPQSFLPIYGYSEVQQIAMEATEGVRKTLYMLNFWKEGTIPDVMLGVPEAWNPEQIAMWQASFDALLSGNTKLKSKIRFIPGGMKPFEMKGSAGELLKSDYDEWITRIICRALRTMPKPYIKEPGVRGPASTEKEQAEEQGLQAFMLWWSAFMDELIVRGWGWTDIGHSFEEGEDSDPVDEQTILSGYVKTAQLTVNESRAKRGLDPVEGGDVAMIFTSQGAMPLSVLAGQTEMPQAGGGAGDGDEEDSASGKGAEKAAAGVPFGKRRRRWRGY